MRTRVSPASTDNGPRVKQCQQVVLLEVIVSSSNRAEQPRQEEAGAADEAPLELSSEWQDWVVDNALEGAIYEDLVEALVEESVDEELAKREVLRLVTSAGFHAAQRWRRQALRYKKATNLRVAYHRAHGPKEIERRSGVSAQELRSRYLRFAEPVILTDVIDQWPALQSWTDEYLKERAGTLLTQVCLGRDASADPDININELFQTLPFSDVVDRIASAGESNDIYLVGNNNFFSNAGAEEILKDLDDKIETYLDGRGLVPDRLSFWFGPAGTRTKLHHDPTGVLYAQIRGQKRFRMLSPNNAPALLSAENTYAKLPVDVAAKEAGDRVYEVVLQPGELLLLPAGWWHEVTALTPSISLGVTNLAGPTSFGWYHPGKVGNEIVARRAQTDSDDEGPQADAVPTDENGEEPGPRPDE